MLVRDALTYLHLSDLHLGCRGRAGTIVIDEPTGIPGFCLPCYRIEKAFEVYNPGNATVPAGPNCAVGEYTFIYTLTHIGGSNGAIPFPVNQFSLDADTLFVTSAGFIATPDVTPSATTIGGGGIIWDFLAPTLVPGDVSDPLFVC